MNKIEEMKKINNMSKEELTVYINQLKESKESKEADRNFVKVFHYAQTIYNRKYNELSKEEIDEQFEKERMWVEEGIYNY